MLVLPLCRALLLCLVCAVLVACGKPTEEQLIGDARSALARGDAPEALVQLKNLMQSAPASAPGRVLLGEALLATGDAPGAVIELERARELGAGDAQTALPLARAYFATGRAGDVVKHLADVSLESPAEHAELRAQLALALMLQGDADRAQAMVEAALAADPTNRDARLYRARFTAAVGDTDDAEQQVQALLADDPGNAGALLLRGEIQLLARSDRQAAKSSFEAAVGAAPTFVAGHLALLNLAAADNNLPAFESRVGTMQAAVPQHPETLIAEIQLALYKADLVSAKDRSEALLLRAPNDARALFLAGLTQFRLGGLAVAEAHLSKAVQQAPAEPGPRRVMAQLHVATGQPGRALDVIAPLLDLEQPDPEVLRLAGQAELQRGRADAAEAHFRRALAVKPSDTVAGTSLAMTQIARGQAEQGLAQLERLAAGTSDVEPDLTLIATLLAQRDFVRALAAAAALEAKAPSLPIGPALRGRVLLLQGDAEAARKSFQQALEISPGYYPGVIGLVELDVNASRWEAAVRRLQDHLKDDPTNYAALQRLVQVQAAANVAPEVIRRGIDAAISARPTDAEPRLLLIEYLAARRDLNAARTVAEAAMTALPTSGDLASALGRVLMEIGDPRPAVAAFSRALELKPASSAAHLQLGQAQIRSGDVEAGRTNLERARQIDPESLDANRALINLWMVERRYGQALNLAREIQRRSPRAAIGYLLEADVYLNQRNMPEALRLVREAHTREPSSDLAVRVHGLQVLANQTAEADRFAADWLRRNPQDVQFVGHLGTQALQRGDFAAAERQYQRVLELKPDDPVALNNVAWSMLQLGRAEPAVPLARKANELLPNQPALQNTLAAALKTTGNLREAADWQRRSVASSNGEPRYRLQLAEMLLALNERGQAREELRALEALGDSFPQRDKVLELARQAR